MNKNLMLEGWEDEEYQAFIDKFKAKKTTDDCYTPPNVYNAVADWVAREYNLDSGRFLRPFYPGGNYEQFNYPAGAPVVDNPPFSILSKIIAFYARRQIPFFLFAPALTLFSSSSSASSTCIPCGVKITYENGANVPTSFVTNMEPRTVRVRTAPSLFQAVKAANDANQAKKGKALPRYEYPDNIITAAMVNRWCKYDVEYSLSVADSLPIGALEAQKKRGVSIFGGGYILGTSAAAERAAAERAAAEKWTLSPEELEIVRYIDERTGGGHAQKLDPDQTL